MKKREDRRDRTIRKGETRRRDHLAIVHPDGVVDCVCEASVWWFAKRKGRGCDCRSRTHGNPKTMGRGICTGGYAYRDAVLERIRSKRLCWQWTVATDREDAEL